jgi:hypothetical protein
MSSKLDHPKTLEDWKAYAATLEGEALRDKAIAANSAPFVRLLKEEGYAAEEIHSILIYIARRFFETGQRPPGGGLYDLFELMRAEPPR